MKVLWRVVGMAHSMLAGGGIALGISHWRSGHGDVFGHGLFAAVMLGASYLFISLASSEPRDASEHAETDAQG